MPDEKRWRLKPAALAALLTIALRVAYTGLAAVAVPHLELDPERIRSNHFTENLMEPSEGVAYVLLGVWERFDTLWYLHIAQQGYDRAEAAVFFPLYPWLIRLCSPASQHGLATALAISTAATFFLFWGMQRLLLPDIGEQAAARAVLLAAVWPGSFILFAGYAESLVAALTVWSVYFARRRQWWAAGLAGLLAGLTKAVGFLVVVPLAWMGWRERSRRVAPLAIALAAPLLVTAWVGGTMQGAYPQHWKTEVVFPAVTLVEGLRQAVGGDVLVRLNLGALILVYVLALGKRIRPEYTLYAAATACLFLAKKTDPLLQSTMRYLLVVFPAFASLATLLRRGPIFAASAMVLFFANAVLMVSFFDWALVV